MRDYLIPPTVGSHSMLAIDNLNADFFAESVENIDDGIDGDFVKVTIHDR